MYVNREYLQTKMYSNMNKRYIHIHQPINHINSQYTMYKCKIIIDIDNEHNNKVMDNLVMFLIKINEIIFAI